MKKRLLGGFILLLLMVAVPYCFTFVGENVAAKQANTHTVIMSEEGKEQKIKVEQLSTQKEERKTDNDTNKTSDKEDNVEKNDKVVKPDEIKLYDNFLIKDSSNGEIIEVSNKDFLIFGLASEVPPTFNKEALKAQAVAIYTYYSKLRETNREKENKDYDFEADLSIGAIYLKKSKAEELWGENYDEYYKIYESVYNSVKNQIIIYENELALTTFYAISSGVTECSENIFLSKVPYLTSVTSPYDNLAPGYKTEKTLTADEMKNLLKIGLDNIELPDNPREWIKINEVNEDTKLVKNMSVGNKEIKGLEFRNIVDLRSPFFDIVFERENFVITVYGFGHGVGLSQYGAEFMAEQGADYKEILTHYYNGVELAKVDA